MAPTSFSEHIQARISVAVIAFGIAAILSPRMARGIAAAQAAKPVRIAQAPASIVSRLEARKKIVSSRGRVTTPAAVSIPGIVRQGGAGSKCVMLTFDDGPHPRYTPRILAVLRKYNIKATFFVVGKMAVRYPELVKAIDADGHLVANHTYDHLRLTKISEVHDRLELEECSNVIEAITGKRPLFCRPPGCRFDAHVVRTAASLGLTVVSYSVNTFDTIDHSKSTIASRVIRDARPGSIVLCHDGFQQTIEALPRIIKALGKKGYTFGTVAQAVP